MEEMKKSPSAQNAVKETIKEILNKMGFSFELEVLVEEKEGEEKIICNIRTEDSNFLIGQYGVNLESLQHIARLMLRKKSEEKINFILDVNFYRKEKNEAVSQLAKAMAEQAITEKRAIVLRPMSPYERRIVHLELADNENVFTESVGEGEERKIVIKPKELC